MMRRCYLPWMIGLSAIATTSPAMGHEGQLAGMSTKPERLGIVQRDAQFQIIPLKWALPVPKQRTTLRLGSTLTIDAALINRATNRDGGPQ